MGRVFANKFSIVLENVKSDEENSTEGDESNDETGDGTDQDGQDEDERANETGEKQKKAGVERQAFKHAPLTMRGGLQGVDQPQHKHMEDYVKSSRPIKTEDFESDIDDPKVWIKREPQDMRDRDAHQPQHEHMKDHVKSSQLSKTECFESDIDDPNVWIKREVQNMRDGDADNYVSTVDETPDEAYMHNPRKAARIQQLEDWEAHFQYHLARTKSELKDLRSY